MNGTTERVFGIARQKHLDRQRRLYPRLACPTNRPPVDFIGGDVEALLLAPRDRQGLPVPSRLAMDRGTQLEAALGRLPAVGPDDEVSVRPGALDVDGADDAGLLFEPVEAFEGVDGLFVVAVWVRGATGRLLLFAKAWPAREAAAIEAFALAAALASAALAKRLPRDGGPEDAMLGWILPAIPFRFGGLTGLILLVHLIPSALVFEPDAPG